MVIEIIRYTIDDDQSIDFEEAYAKASQYLIESPHCLNYQATRCVEESNRYIVRIEWDSMDGHLKGFRQSAAFREFFALVRPFFNSIDEMQHYQAI
jgi:quinol monooxygenase YgiN